MTWQKFVGELVMKKDFHNPEWRRYIYPSIQRKKKGEREKRKKGGKCKKVRRSLSEGKMEKL